MQTKYVQSITWGDDLHYTITISALDDIINGVHKSEFN